MKDIIEKEIKCQENEIIGGPIKTKEALAIAEGNKYVRNIYNAWKDIDVFYLLICFVPISFQFPSTSLLI